MMFHFNCMEFSKGCSKGLLLALNGFCILLAFCTLGFAVVDTRILHKYGEEMAGGTLAGDLIIIAASLLLVAVAAFGCVGAVRENVKILYLYVGLLMILVLLELLIAIFVAVERYGLEFSVTDWLREEFFRNVTVLTEEQLSVHNKIWDILQSEYQCCGLNGPEDYSATQRQISVSCCPRAYRARDAFAQKHLYRSCVDSGTYYSEGCEDEILYLLRADADYLLGVAVISFWFEGAGMMLATWVANNLKSCKVHVYDHSGKY